MELLGVDEFYQQAASRDVEGVITRCRGCGEPIDSGKYCGPCADAMALAYEEGTEWD